MASEISPLQSPIHRPAVEKVGCNLSELMGRVSHLWWIAAAGAVFLGLGCGFIWSWPIGLLAGAGGVIAGLFILYLYGHFTAPEPYDSTAPFCNLRSFMAHLGAEKTKVYALHLDQDNREYAKENGALEMRDAVKNLGLESQIEIEEISLERYREGIPASEVRAVLVPILGMDTSWWAFWNEGADLYYRGGRYVREILESRHSETPEMHFYLRFFRREYHPSISEYESIMKTYRKQAQEAGLDFQTPWIMPSW